MRTKQLMVVLVVGWAIFGPSGGATTLAQSHAEIDSATELHGDSALGVDEHGDHATDAAHGEASHGDTNPVTLDPDLAVVTAIIFLVLLAVLWKFAWGPIVSALDKREQTVADQLAEARRNQEEARRMLSDHEARLSGAAAEVKQLLDQARRDADAQKQQIVESAQAAATAEKDRALREIGAAKNAALQDLATKSVDTAVDLAAKIVGRQLTSDDHTQLIGDALQRFSNEN